MHSLFRELKDKEREEKGRAPVFMIFHFTELRSC